MKYKIGFIGAGNMAGTILSSVVKNGIFNKNEIIAYDVSENILNKLKEETIAIAKNNAELVAESDFILLGVKPNIITKVADDIKDSLNENCVIISIAAGWSVSKLRETFGKNQKIIRVMPNMPALANEGMTVFSKDNNLSAEELKTVSNIFSGIGKVQLLDDKHMDTVTALTGSGPAIIFMLIDALADAAVLRGIPKATAVELASQMVKGSAAAVQISSDAPSVLKDKVCSPGGTTIESVYSLEKNSFNSIVMDAVLAAAEKSEKLGK